MAVAVKEIELWRTEVENKPGVLAKALEPLARAGADLHILMGYRYPGNESRAAIEVFPVKGKKAVAAAESTGMQPAGIPALLVEGDDRPGLGHAIAQSLAEADVNISFLIAQTVKGTYSAVIGLETAADAKAAAALIKKASSAKRKVA